MADYSINITALFLPINIFEAVYYLEPDCAGREDGTEPQVEENNSRL